MSQVLEAQGEALIIELRRLQRAIAADEAERYVPPREGSDEQDGVISRYFRGIGGALGRTSAVLGNGFEYITSVARSSTAESAVSIPELPAADSRDAAPSKRLQPDWCRRSVAVVRTGADFVLARGAFSSAHGATPSDWIEHLGLAFEGQLRTALRVLIVSGLVAVVLCAVVPLSGAVVLSARLVVESHVKEIQHPTGGVVATIAAHDAMHVKAGDMLLRLDGTQIEANYGMYLNQFRELEMRIARLMAERDGRDIDVPSDLAGSGDDKEVQQIVASERTLFEARKKALSSQKMLLQNNVEQYNQQLAGVRAQIDSKTSQSELIGKELSGVQQLYDKGLVPLTRLTALKRETAALTGDRGQLQSALAETSSKIDQTLLQVIKIDQDFRAEVTKDLTDSQVRLSDVSQKLVAIRDELKHLDIRSPIDGIVHELSAHTIAGVIRPGEVIMKVVPDTDAMEVEAHLPPKDIEQVRTGQRVSVKFPALNSQTTPELNGTVAYVSPDVTSDKTGANSFYTVRISISEAERARLHNMPLTSGTPVEAFLRLRDRTMMSYLLKPLVDQFDRMFTEP